MILSDTILHKGNSSEIGKLNSFVPDTMAAVEAAVEATAGAASRAKVTAGHGSGKCGKEKQGSVHS